MVELTLALVAFLLPLAYSPGPGNMVFAANGARFGMRATVPANVGYHVATWLVTVAIGFGFVVVVERAPDLFTAIKWAGSAYVLYLAWKLFRAGVLNGALDAQPAGFVDGVVLLLLNPKAYLIIALMFTQFLAESGLDRTTAVLWISTVFTLNNLGAFVAWTAVGDRLAARFRDDGHAKALNAIFGALLAAVAVWMMLG